MGSVGILLDAPVLVELDAKECNDDSMDKGAHYPAPKVSQAAILALQLQIFKILGGIDGLN